MKKDIENYLKQSHQLSQQAFGDAVSPEEVVLILSKIGARHVLIGGHMLSFYTGTPRATVDVDIIVSAAHVKKAIDAISLAFPQFDEQDLVYNVRFSSRAGGQGQNAERIDIVRSNTPLFDRIIKSHAVAVEADGRIVHLPSIEAAIALKFAAAVSPNRGDEKRPQDRTDLMLMISRNRSLNQGFLKELGNLAYPGGGEELVALVAGIHGGEPVSI